MLLGGLVLHSFTSKFEEQFTETALECLQHSYTTVWRYINIQQYMIQSHKVIDKMALQIRELHFPLSAKSLGAVVAWNPRQCGNWAVNSAVTQGKNRASHTAAPGLVLALCHHLMICCITNTFLEQQRVLQLPGLLLCLFFICALLFREPPSKSRRHLGLCSVSVLWSSVRRGKLSLRHLWGEDSACTPGKILSWTQHCRQEALHFQGCSQLLPEPAAWGGLCHWVQVLCAAG